MPKNRYKQWLLHHHCIASPLLGKTPQLDAKNRYKEWLLWVWFILFTSPQFDYIVTWFLQALVLTASLGSNGCTFVCLNALLPLLILLSEKSFADWHWKETYIAKCKIELFFIRNMTTRAWGISSNTLWAWRDSNFSGDPLFHHWRTKPFWLWDFEWFHYQLWKSLLHRSRTNPFDSNSRSISLNLEKFSYRELKLTTKRVLPTSFNRYRRPSNHVSWHHTRWQDGGHGELACCCFPSIGESTQVDITWHSRSV